MAAVFYPEETRVAGPVPNSFIATYQRGDFWALYEKLDVQENAQHRKFWRSLFTSEMRYLDDPSMQSSVGAPGTLAFLAQVRRVNIPDSVVRV